MNIPPEMSRTILSLYELRGEMIRRRLQEFRACAPADYFYELCYCLLTPQSKALHCDSVVRLLRAREFHRREFDPEPYLHPSKSVYVRFHKTKARRLIAMKHSWPAISRIITQDIPATELREVLVELVSGLGYKEASHFLRNIGRTQITILDRHILRALKEANSIDSEKVSLTRRRYLTLEREFEAMARHLNIPQDELDLLLWSRETGIVLK